MKFYKLIEIEEDEYVAKTNDYNYDYCAQSVIKGEEAFYIAVNDDSEDCITVSIEDLSETENSEEE